MRKDVKLGFAIGGVLLAVLIVYVLVVPGGGDKRLSQADNGGNGGAQANGGGVSLEPVAPSDTTAPTTQPRGGAVVQTPPAAPPSTFTPPAGETDPFEQPRSDDAPLAKSDTKDVDWSKLLNDSQMLMVTPAKPPGGTPVKPKSADAQPGNTQVALGGAPDITKPGPTPIAAPPAAQPESAPVPAPEQTSPTAPTTDAPPAQQPQSNDAADLPPAVEPPATTPEAAEPRTVLVDPPVSQPPPQTDIGGNTADTTGSTAAGAAKTHVVEMGETFTTISLKAYGNPNLYTGIMRANPGIDPQKLRPGMKIVVPPISEVRPPAPAPAAAAAAPVNAAPIRTISTDGAQMARSTRAEQPIDPQTQYRVQPGDSLYSIAKRLYGRGDRSTRIFEANRQTMGDDMNALKVGQVLTLPEPPAAQQ